MGKKKSPVKLDELSFRPGLFFEPKLGFVDYLPETVYENWSALLVSRDKDSKCFKYLSLLTLRTDENR